MANLKWFHYEQNNSGGYNIYNDQVGDGVFVQAENAEAANNKAFKITEDYSEFCECCGERWWIAKDDDDGTDVPMLYDTPLMESESSWYRRHYVLHFNDGRVVNVDLKNKEAVETL